MTPIENKLLLEVSDLTVSVNGTKLIDHLGLTLRGGELLSVIGPNGAGKSSLIRGITNDFAVDQQINIQRSVFFKQQSLDDFSAIERARHLAVLPQASQLTFPFSVAEVLHLGRTPHQSGQRIDREIVNEVAQRLEIDDLLQRHYTQLSGGEKQRVQIGRVLVQIWPEKNTAGEKLLILDEPMAALDIVYQQQIMQILKQLTNTGVGVLAVMHDINLAARFSDQMLALKAGRLVASGSVGEVLRTDVLHRVFGVTTSIIRHPASGELIAVVDPVAAAHPTAGNELSE